jgi:hypothetical protein
MFDNVIVGIDDYDAGRDAVGLATQPKSCVSKRAAWPAAYTSSASANAATCS